MKIVVIEEAALEEDPRDGKLANRMDSVNEAWVRDYDRIEQAENKIHAGGVWWAEATFWWSAQ